MQIEPTQSTFSSEEKFRLKDGRDLSYAISGSDIGIPIFFFHGTPGSRHTFASEDRFANLPGVRMIFPERPGYGYSSPKPDRTLIGWPDDVVELADHLGLGRFAVSGASGGGPHALACAWKYPERVFAAYVFASPAPVDRLGDTKGMVLGNRLNYFLGSKMSWLVRILMRSYAKTVLKKPDKFLAAIAKQMPPSDRAVLEQPEAREAFIRDFTEAYRQGSDAQFIDGQLMMSTRPWGFDLSQIKVPVHLWHGEQDTLVPAGMTDRFNAIPNANLRIVPNAGHLVTEVSTVVDEFENALRADWQNYGQWQ